MFCVCSGHFRIARMGDERNARRPEATLRLIRTGDLRCKRFGEGAIDFRKVDADLLEHFPAHQTHTAPAKIFAAIAAFPLGQLKPAGCAGIERAVCGVFERFESGANVGLQGSEPLAGAGFLGVEIAVCHGATHGARRATLASALLSQA